MTRRPAPPVFRPQPRTVTQKPVAGTKPAAWKPGAAPQSPIKASAVQAPPAPLGPIAPPVYRPGPVSILRSRTVQRMDSSGVYTTQEEGKNKSAYDRAVAQLGSADAHQSGSSGDGISSKFLNQEAKLQEKKKEILALDKKVAERQAANERAQEKSEAISARREKEHIRHEAGLMSLLRYLRDHFDDFPSIENKQYYRALLSEKYIPVGDKKVKATKQLVEDNLEELLQTLKKL